MSIPEVVIVDGKEYNVTSIGVSAFLNCTDLTSLIIPKSIVSIGENAFNFYSGLTSIHISDISAWCKINFADGGSNPLWYARRLYLNNEEITELEIPNNITTINNWLFYNCSSLTSIIIPNSVISIGESAFSGCCNLTSVTIPNSVTSIGDAAFASCNSLITLNIPNSVISIGESAFIDCSSLPSITLSDNLTSIGYSTFAGCNSLTAMNIPNGVTSIGERAFVGCYSLTSVNIPSSVTSIGNYAFQGCSNLTSIIIPDGITTIGHFTFDGCSNLNSISIPNSVISIDGYAFHNCSNIASLSLPSCLTSIGDNAFGGCSSLTTLNIPNTVTSIGIWAFYGCKSLISIILPSSLTSIGDYTFSTCKGLSSITIPNTITTIGNYVFEQCNNLTSIIIPNSVTTIGDHAFANCSGLINVTLPNDIRMIKRNTFEGCSSLKNIVIPSKVEYIYQEAFANCSSMERIESMPINPPFLYDNSFSNYFVPLKVPKGCKEAYQTAQGWKNFTNISDADKYNLTYMVDNEVYKIYEIEEGTSITPESAPTKEGYTFSGWSEIPSTMPAKNVTVTGTFTINKYKLVYMVDGTEYKSYEIEYGAKITPEAEPTKEGYTFSGWSSIPETMPAKDVTITGSFTINKYKLVYMVDGTEYKSYEIEYGAKITPEAEPTKEGYTFSGWSNIPETMPAKDVTVTGSFTKGAYKLTYMVDGAVYKTVTYNYGDAITPEPAPTKEGYSFSGWSDIPSTMPAKDVTVTGTFTINKYKLIYMVDGTEYKSYEIEYGAKITPEPAPTKEGYTFSGWSSIPETMPANDVTITGTFTKGAYKLIYIVDGEVYKTVTYDFGAAITPEPAPTKEGYTFSGWSEIPSTMPAKDVTITGSFTINKYKLIYLIDNEVYKTYDIEYGATITPEAAPIKENYLFSGWSDIPQTMPAHDVTVTGSFTYVPPKAYTLTYMVDGEVYKTEYYYEGDAITPVAEPTKEGYTFSGWSEIPSTMPAKDVTVTGTFTINKYKLVYMVDGTEYKSYEIEYGAKITPEAEPTKEGYTFSGWSSIPETMPAKDVTVTGTFTKGAYKLTYMVDGEVYKTVTYDYGATITPEAEPTKEGYTFSGWSEIPSTMPAKDVTVSGTFTINKYKLIYMVDGTEYKSYEIEYGAMITPEAEPTKEGYTFSGWSSIPETMPAKDVTVTGSFTKGAYKLTYMVDGEVYKTVTYNYGATITPEPAPTKEGYTFSGWSDIPSTMPAKDVTVSGTFTINKYKLIYMVDGTEYKSYEIEYGAKITPEAEPTKEGYTFSGWSSIPETMPAQDVTVTGTFSKGAYKLTYMVDGEVYKTISYDYGATITPEAEPTKEGYTFSGWSNIPETMPAKDVTVTGTFTINKYKLVYMVDGSEYKSYDIEYGSYITPEPEPSKDGYTFSGWSEIPTTMPAHDVEITGTFTQVEFVIDDVTYEISGEGTVTIKGCDQKGEVTIDATVVINGQTYHVTAIAENAFKDNQSITSVTISDGITTIGDNAFNGCIGLIVINIGKDVQTIGNKAFANVGTTSATRTRSEESMLIVNCYTESIPYTASDAFENTPIEMGTLYVVDNLKDAYKSTSPWSRFGKIIGFDESTGINAIMNDSGNALIFDMQGNRLDNVRKGVNIIRTRDGKTKKMIVK